MKRLALALVALVIALAACEFRFEVDLNDDGTGRFSFLMAIEKQFMSLVEQFGGGQNPFGKLDQLRRELPPGFDVEKYDARGLEGFRIGIPFKDVEDLKAKLREFAQGFAQGLGEQLGGDLGNVSGGVTDEFANFTLARKPDGGWRFRAEAAASGGLDLGDAGASAGIDVSQLAKLLDIQLRVRLPGDPLTHNATSTERKDGKTTFTWKADPTSKEKVKLVAETKPAPSSFPVVPVAAAGGAVVLAAAAFAMARRSPAPAPAEPAPPASPLEPPEPPVTP